ncbi:MAG: FAD-dependent oxidoreductase [Acidimicrobiales bacterium]
MKTTKRALVVGGGVIGLTSAFRLASDGWQVSIFDPTPGRGATWAAAGMIAPVAEIGPGEESNYELQRGALSAWRAFARDLQRISDHELTIEETGTLLVGWDGSDRRLVDQYAQVVAELGVVTQRVSRLDRPEMFDGVTPRIADGLLVEGDAWLDPDQVVSVVRSANDRLEVSLIEETVVRVCAHDDRVEAVTSSGSFVGDVGIIATGAGLLPAGAIVSGEHVVRPIHGITVRVRGIDRSAQPMIRSFVRGNAFYMVSRPGGYDVLGASSEERREQGAQVGEVQRLLRDGLDVVPSLETAVVLETRDGNRPASEDLRPFFEVLSDRRWAWSSGHFRHGVTLAPFAADQALRFAQSFA